jgi:hypothetical protein
MNNDQAAQLSAELIKLSSGKPNDEATFRQMTSVSVLAAANVLIDIAFQLTEIRKALEKKA